MLDDEDVLAHHGVKGMKWGVRRARKKTSSQSRSSRSTRYQNPATKRLKRKQVKALSDAELREKINRLNLEKQYRELSRADISAGRKWVNDVLNASSKKIVTDFLTAQGTKALMKMVEKSAKKAVK